MEGKSIHVTEKRNQSIITATVPRKLNTRGCCFLCLQLLDFKLEVDSNSKEDIKPNTFSERKSVSFRSIRRFLNIEIQKLFSKSSKPTDSIGSKNKNEKYPVYQKEGSEIETELCESCNKIVERFTHSFLIMEKAQMEVLHWLERIHQRISEASKNTEVVQNYSKRMTSDKEALGQLAFVDNFRKEIAKRSLHRKKFSSQLKVKLLRLGNNEHLRKSRTPTQQNQFELNLPATEFYDELYDNAVDSPCPEVDSSNVDEKCDINYESIEGEDCSSNCNPFPAHHSLSSTTYEPVSKVTVKIIQSRELKMWIKNLENGAYECSSCKKSFKCSSDACRHYKSVHLLKKYKCSYCELTYSSMSGLSRHKNQDHEEKVSKERETFRKNREKVNKRYKCIYCGASYTIAKSLLYHKKANHPEKLKREREKVNFERAITKVEKEMKRENNMMKNPKQRILGKMVLRNSETGKWNCTKCDKEFAFCSRSAARNHYESIHLKKRHQCDLCGLTVATRKSLFQHQKNHKDKVRKKNVIKKEKGIRKEKVDKKKSIDSKKVETVGKMCLVDHETGKLLCIQCKKEFKSRIGAKVHYESIHLKMRHKCEICNIASYISEKKLVVHKKTCKDKLPGILAKIKERETDPKYKFKCPTCSRRFKIKKVMEEHLNQVHLNKKKYVCKICKKSFKSSNFRNEHTKAVHFGRKLKCKVCDRQFSYTSTLSQHERKCEQKKTEKKEKEMPLQTS